MKNIFNEADKKEILQRIEKLTPESKALWGKMDVAQMLAHCTKGLQLPTGEIPTKKAPIQLIGSLFKNKFIKSEKPFGKNAPTTPELKMVDKMEFQLEKGNLITAVTNFTADSVKAERHPFFGKMTLEEWGLSNYKHADHHLRQFGV